MKKELRGLLEHYYAAPGPQRKQAFLNRLCVPRRRMRVLLFAQLRYIPKVVWILSLVLFAAMIAVENLFSAAYAGSVYALVPFLSAVTVSASMCSCRYHMAELEGTTLFSLGSVVMMRMLLLGFGNLLFLAVFAFFLEPSFFLVEFMYILAPYMLTGSGSLFVYRRYAQRDANYMSLAISGFVAALELYTTKSAVFLFEESRAGLWAFLCISLVALFGFQMRKSMQAMEELVWN